MKQPRYCPDFVSFLRAWDRTPWRGPAPLAERAERRRASDDFVRNMVEDADAGLVPPVFPTWLHLLDWMQREPVDEWRNPLPHDMIAEACLLWRRWHNQWLAKLRDDLGDLY